MMEIYKPNIRFVMIVKKILKRCASFVPGIKYGDVREWQYCWSRYLETDVPSERKLLLKAMGVASDQWLLQR